jgi:hypothetical protein
VLKAVQNGLMSTLGIPADDFFRDDLMVMLYEVIGEDISFGHGLA